MHLRTRRIVWHIAARAVASASVHRDPAGRESTSLSSRRQQRDEAQRDDRQADTNANRYEVTVTSVRIRCLHFGSPSPADCLSASVRNQGPTRRTPLRLLKKAL